MSSQVSIFLFYPNFYDNNIHTPKSVSVLSKRGDYLHPNQRFLVITFLEHFHLLFKAISPDTVLLKFFYFFGK